MTPGRFHAETGATIRNYYVTRLDDFPTHTEAIRTQHAGEHAVQECRVGGFTCDIQLLLDDLAEQVEALPEPTLGLKGGVSREAVLRLIRGEKP